MSTITGQSSLLADSEIVEWLDPDWRDHFPGTAEAAEFYCRYSRAEWDAAVAEIIGERPIHPESAVTPESGA